MGRILQKFRRQDSGSAVIEACIVVPLFLFFVLTMYGLITVFLAQNIIGHTPLQSSQSLALDAYATEQFTTPQGIGSVESGIRDFFLDLTGSSADDPHFSNSERWYDRKHGATSEDWAEAAEARFLGYFSGGDRAAADAILKSLRVTGGVDGLDFSGSKLEGNDLYIRVSYQVEYFFNPFGLAEFSTTQQAYARMWGASVQE